MLKGIYLDNAATTPVDERVLKSMIPYFNDKYANPSTMYSIGREAKEAIETSRRSIAKLLNCNPSEIIFTAGGTESDNLAIIGFALANKTRGKHIITSSIEHHAVLDACKFLESQGFFVTYLPVDKNGFVSAERLDGAIQKDTILVSIMYANNEIGTIQNIKELTKVAHKHNVKLHTDACQAAGYLNMNTHDLGVDMMTLNGSKIYGPKQIGILYIARGTGIKPIIHGGGQENNLRSGTENVPAIMGLAKALELAENEKEKEVKRLTKLRDWTAEQLKKEIPRITINGDLEKRLPNNIHVSIPRVQAESLVLTLDEKKVYVGMGSACTTGSMKPSHVLKAIGLTDKESYSSIRITMGRHTTEEHMKMFIRYLKESLEEILK